LWRASRKPCLWTADDLRPDSSSTGRKRKKDGKKKQPYRIIMADDRMFDFAGLWERWRSPAGE
jgi:putative SOS response-associated peptidase YedK